MVEKPTIDEIKKVLLASKEMIDEADHIANRLLTIKEQLFVISGDIINHLEKGDTTNSQINSKLWHDLNNIIHQFNSFSQFAPDIFQDATIATKKLSILLQNARPGA
jgi:hypothetical protein